MHCVQMQCLLPSLSSGDVENINNVPYKVLITVIIITWHGKYWSVPLCWKWLKNLLRSYSNVLRNDSHQEVIIWLIKGHISVIFATMTLVSVCDVIVNFKQTLAYSDCNLWAHMNAISPCDLEHELKLKLQIVWRDANDTENKNFIAELFKLVLVYIF